MPLIKRNSCPTCKSRNFKRMFSLPYNSEKIVKFIKTYYKNSLNIIELDGYEYTLLECLNCSLIFQEQIPDEEFSIKLYEKIIDQDESLAPNNIRVRPSDIINVDQDTQQVYPFNALPKDATAPAVFSSKPATSS